jgi:hypothetical protein
MKIMLTVLLVAAFAGVARAASNAPKGKCAKNVIHYSDYQSCVAYQKSIGYNVNEIENFCRRACPGG